MRLKTRPHLAAHNADNVNVFSQMQLKLVHERPFADIDASACFGVNRVCAAARHEEIRTAGGWVRLSWLEQRRMIKKQEPN